MKEKILIIYHRVDFDGIFSAIIARKYYESVENKSVTTFGYTYNDEVPNLGSYIFKNVRRVVLVDVSFSADIMLSLLEQFGHDNVEWVDHHTTAINDSEKYQKKNCIG